MLMDITIQPTLSLPEKKGCHPFELNKRSIAYAKFILHSFVSYYKNLYGKLSGMTKVTADIMISKSQYKNMQELSHRAYNMNFERFLKCHGINAKVIVIMRHIKK